MAKSKMNIAIDKAIQKTKKKEQTVPYPIRIPISHVEVLRKNEIDVPSFVRIAISELVDYLKSR